MRLTILILSIVAFTATLPAIIELCLFLFANLLLGRSPRNGTSERSGEDIGSIAVLVPAHDEEKNIERCVRSLLDGDAGRFRKEVIVIADNCSDRTAELAAGAGARVIVRFDEKVRGKGAAIHYAVTALAREHQDAFIIVDADSVVGPDFLRVMGESFSAGKEAIQCVYLPLNRDASSRTRLMRLALLSMNVLRPRGRELLGLSAGIMGNGFGLTRRLLEAVPYTANSITEDLEYHLKLLEGGRRVRFVREASVLADFPVSREGAETQRDRWEGGRFLLQRRFFPRLLRSVLSGRLRMLEPLMELMSLPLSYETLLLLSLAIAPAQPFGWYGVVGIGVVFLQVVASIALYGDADDYKALASIPAYLAWKAMRLPHILATSRKDAKWIRTKRD